MKAQLDRCSRVVNQLLVGAGDPSAACIEHRPLVDLIDECKLAGAKQVSIAAQRE